MARTGLFVFAFISVAHALLGHAIPAFAEQNACVRVRAAEMPGRNCARVTVRELPANPPRFFTPPNGAVDKGFQGRKPCLPFSGTLCRQLKQFLLVQTDQGLRFFSRAELAVAGDQGCICPSQRKSVGAVPGAGQLPDCKPAQC